MEGLAPPPSPRWLTFHQLALVSKPGHFFLFEGTNCRHLPLTAHEGRLAGCAHGRSPPSIQLELDNVPWSKAVTRRAMTTAIGEELRTRYQPPDQLSPELRQVLRKVQCSDTRHPYGRPRRSHEMWLTDDEPRRIAEISLRFLSS